MNHHHVGYLTLATLLGLALAPPAFAQEASGDSKIYFRVDNGDQNAARPVNEDTDDADDGDEDEDALDDIDGDGIPNGDDDDVDGDGDPNGSDPDVDGDGDPNGDDDDVDGDGIPNEDDDDIDGDGLDNEIDNDIDGDGVDDPATQFTADSLGGDMLSGRSDNFTLRKRYVLSHRPTLILDSALGVETTYYSSYDQVEKHDPYKPIGETNTQYSGYPVNHFGIVKVNGDAFAAPRTSGSFFEITPMVNPPAAVAEENRGRYAHVYEIDISVSFDRSNETLPSKPCGGDSAIGSDITTYYETSHFQFMVADPVDMSPIQAWQSSITPRERHVTQSFDGWDDCGITDGT